MKHTIALLGAITAVAAAPATAMAATGISVRVEGQSQTLLPATVVHVHAGSITKGGAPKGACSATSAAGALDTATHHRWNGKFYTSFSDYLITSILGVSYSGSKAKYFWDFFVNGVSASAGACSTTPHSGDQLMFAAVPLIDYGAYALVISGAPAHATAGRSFTVKVQYVNAKGKKVALRGARLTGKDFTPVSTGANGSATITPLKAGTLTLGAAHAPTKQGKHVFGYVRAPAATVHIN